MIRLELETALCPNCESPEWKTVARPGSHCHRIGGRFAVVRCNCCGLLYLNPRPTQDSLRECYETLEEGDVSPAPTDSSDGRKTLVRRLWHKLNYSNPVLALIDRGPVLDIGCNRGDLLSTVSTLGHEAYGLDSNPRAVADCLRRGLSVRLGDVENTDIPKRFYKCIVLSHALEHLRNPVSELRKLREALQADGKIVICVPNCRSPMTKLFGASWHGWDPPFHLVHFDKTTLKQVCERAGFVVTRVQVKGHPEDLTRSLDIWSGKTRRHLMLRAALWPLFAAAGAIGYGSYIVAVAELWQDNVRELGGHARKMTNQW